MVGQFSGVAKLPKEKCPLLHCFYCMAHRIDLATKNAVGSVTAASRFRYFVDELYKTSACPPKIRLKREQFS